MWTALDGRKIYASMVEISEVHENLLQDLLTERFGWSWTLKQDTNTKAVVNEVEGVPQELINAFSSRDAEIDLLLKKKIKEYETSTGKQAGWKTKAELHKEAWLATRKAKPEIQPSLKAKRDHWFRKLGEVAPGIQIDQMFKDVNSHKTGLMHVDAEGEDDIARLLLGQLADLGVESIEQPIPARCYREMAILCGRSPVPIALDEDLICVLRGRECR